MNFSNHLDRINDWKLMVTICQPKIPFPTSFARAFNVEMYAINVSNNYQTAPKLQLTLEQRLLIYCSTLIAFFNLFSDINECTSDQQHCHWNAYCTNLEGSFNCTCKHGYQGDGSSCQGHKKQLFYDSNCGGVKINDVKKYFDCIQKL